MTRITIVFRKLFSPNPISDSEAGPAALRRAAISMIVAGAAASALTAPPALSHADPITPDDAASFNLFIPGTWETDESADPWRAIGALKPVADRIRHDHGASAVIYFLPYVARAFDNGESYGSSKETAIDNAARVLRDFTASHPAAKFTITGYSQGADAAGDLAAAIGNHLGPIPPDKVLAVALLADPRAGTSGETAVGPRADGIGIADPRPQGMGSLVGRVSSICAPDDLYCSIDKRQNPFLGQLGSALGKTPADAAHAVRRAATAASILAELDLPGIVDGLESLPKKVAAGDLAAAHSLAGTLNNDMRPLVRLAAMVDFAEVSATLALIPDDTGFTKAMSLVAAALSHVDIERTAELVGKIQEVSWVAIAAVGRHAGAKTVPTTVTSMADLKRLARELATLSSSVVTATPQSGTGVDAVAPDLKSAAKDVIRISAKYAITNPATLITDAVSAGEFYASESHVRYGSLVVDKQGHDAVDWLGAWLSASISRAR